MKSVPAETLNILINIQILQSMLTSYITGVILKNFQLSRDRSSTDSCKMFFKEKFLSTSALIISLFVVVAVATFDTTLNSNVQWTAGSFQWPCPTTKNMFKSSGRYVPKNVIATRAAIFNDDAIVALPRYIIINILDR